MNGIDLVNIIGSNLVTMRTQLSKNKKSINLIETPTFQFPVISGLKRVLMITVSEHETFSSFRDMIEELEASDIQTEEMAVILNGGGGEIATAAHFAALIRQHRWGALCTTYCCSAGIVILDAMIEHPDFRVPQYGYIRYEGHNVTRDGQKDEVPEIMLRNRTLRAVWHHAHNFKTYVCYAILINGKRDTWYTSQDSYWIDMQTGVGLTVNADPADWFRQEIDECISELSISSQENLNLEKILDEYLDTLYLFLALGGSRNQLRQVLESDNYNLISIAVYTWIKKQRGRRRFVPDHDTVMSYLITSSNEKV